MTAAGARFLVSRAVATLSRGRWIARSHALRPFVGYLEEVDGGGSLAGWILDPRGAIARVTARGGGTEWELNLRRSRADVESMFGARAVGFRGPLSIDVAPIEVWVYDRSGIGHCAFVARHASAGNLAPEWMLRWRERKVRTTFERVVLAAAGDEFPLVTRATPLLFEELRRCWHASGRPWSELRRALTDEAPARRMSRSAPAGRCRILVVSGMFPSLMHGGGLRLFDLLVELAKRHEVDLCASFREELDARSMSLLRPHLHDLHVAPELTESDVEHWLAQRGRRPGDYDIAHFEFPESAPLIRGLRRWAGRSFFTMMECRARARLIDLERALGGAGDVAVATRELAQELFGERRALRLCDVAIAVTDVDAEFKVRCHLGPRPEVIPTCVSPRLTEELAATTDDPTPLRRLALLVGYFDHRPNRDALHWYLERVHPMLVARLSDYRFRIVGSGDLTALRSRWGELPSVEWVGAVEALPPHLSAARVGLAPIVSGAGIRGKINQYSAAGRPTVSTALGAAGLPYRNEESILIADTPTVFASAIERLLTDDDLWRKLARRSRTLVAEHFSWPAVVERLETAYRR